ncbi:MAG: MATE family efflux transporter [Granulosicoccus sp.]|nr:MATE family efflux transporter [Granulosicoccus sp.]
MLSENASARRWREHVLRLAVPVMVSNSTVSLVGIVDTAVMGRMGSPEWVAATAVGAIIFSSIYWVFGFLRMATGGLVAQATGQNNPRNSGRISSRALMLGIIGGLLLLSLHEPLLTIGLAAMEEDSQWQTLTAAYFNIRILSAPATLCNYVLIGTLVGLQRMGTVLALQLLLNLTNIFLNILFFALTDWDIRGVAIATVISEYITVVAGLWLLRRLLLPVISGGQISAWLFDRQELSRYFRISGDLFIRTLCLTFAFYWMTVLSSRQGVAVLAANTVLLHMIHFAAHCMDGFSDATESLTGFAVGRRSTPILMRAVRAACELGLVAAIIFAGIFATAGELVINTLVTDPLSRSIAVHWLPWIVVAPILGIWSFLLDGIFIGATETASMRNSMIISLALFLLIAWASVPSLGNAGIWISYFTLLVVRSATLAWSWPKVVAATSQP